ncbi:MAG: four helix bundle protein [Flavobacteriales bacterium]|nr:four helix bundle protein [Flavobacteriales bacterium]
MRNDLLDRLLEFAANIVHMGAVLNKSLEGRHIYKQLFRSGTGAGANYAESQSAESKKDFIHKIQVSLKELKESLFWLRLVEKADLAPDKEQLLALLLRENGELIKILGKSVVTAKSNT